MPLPDLMRLSEHEREARKILAEARVDSPGLCARILTARAAGLDKISYILAAEQELSAEGAARLAEMLARRAAGEPLAYILGEREFYGLRMRVSRATLTPRPETELLVEQALHLLPEERILFADLGCGSGCIGAALLALRPAWHGIAIDLSGQALEVAQENLGFASRSVQIIQADIFNLPLAEGGLDLIISNPPYIGRHEENQVMWETLAHEPHCALFSGCDGLAHLQAVIVHARHSLKSGGWLILEHGDRQGGTVKDLLQAAGFTKVEDLADLANLPRCAIAQKS